MKASMSVLLVIIATVLLSAQAAPPLGSDKENTLAACDGCTMNVNGVNYHCCAGFHLGKSGACLCQDNLPCHQCYAAKTNENPLPQCGGCYSSQNGVYFTCADCTISFTNGQCACGDGSQCTKCSKD